MLCLRTLGTAILILATLVGTTAAQTGMVSFTLSSAYNCDLLGTDGLIAAATNWGPHPPVSDYTIFDVFGGHFGMNAYSDKTCYYVNNNGAVPVSGAITTPYATYQLGPASLATSATTQASFVPSPNVIIFGKSLDGPKTVTVNLPASQQKYYSSVNFLLVYWHWRGTTSDQSITLSASYENGSTQVLYTGTIPGWNVPPDGTFNAALTCSFCVGFNTQGTPRYSTLWNYPSIPTNHGPWRIFEFSKSATAFYPTYSTSKLMGFQFSAVESGSGAESLAVILAGAGCLAPNQPAGAPLFMVNLSPSWVYQNTPATLARGGHCANLTVTITNSNGNSSFTSSVQAVTGPGVVVPATSGSTALVWEIQGSSRTDGSSGTGLLTLQVTVSGNSGGPATQQVTMLVRKLGDLDGCGTVDGGDLVLMNEKLDGLPVPCDDAAFDLNGDGAVTTDDRVLLNLVLNNLPVP